MARDRGQETSSPWWLRLLDKTNLIVTSLTASFLLYTRSVGAVYFTAGALACSLSVKLVKKVLRQPRPAHALSGSKRKKTYGMPSTHSATITFFALYITLACHRLPIHPSLSSNELLTRTLPPLLALPTASLIVVSRIWLGHHTWPQIAVGSGYGAAFAAVWFKLWVGGWNVYGKQLEEQFLPLL